MSQDFMNDWRAGYEADSDQLKPDDLGEGRTLRIARVRSEQTGEKKLKRPVIYFEETDKKWVTCFTTCECIEAMFGKAPRGWLGKDITLYWDPSVKFGSDTVGGVRVVGAPGIRNMTVTVQLPKRKPMRIKLINTGPAEPAQPAVNLDNLLTGAGLTVADVDHWRSTIDKGPIADLTDDQRAAMAAWLAGDPTRLETIRRLRDAALADELADDAA